MNELELLPAQPEHQALAVREPQGMALAGVNIEALLNKAIDAKSAVEVMERLQAMRRELRAEQAKEAYDAAMAAFQSECPIIVKKKMGAKDAYRFAPLDDIVHQVRDLIRKHGFSFSITSEIEAGWVKAQCKVTHTAGHSEVSEFKVPIDNKNPMMTEPQRYGGAMTFSKRYSFCNAFGILTADEDTDGRTQTARPAGPGAEGAAEHRILEGQLWAVMKDVRGAEKNWNAAHQWLWREEILDGAKNERVSQLPLERLKAVLAQAKAKLNG